MRVSSYTSQLSGATTLSHSPDEFTDAQKRRDEKIWQLQLEHRASLPYNQFDVQSSEELQRLFQADRNRTYHPRPGIESIYKHADAIVRERWIDQGIWKDEWNGGVRTRQALEARETSRVRDRDRVGYRARPRTLRQ
ncbi:hypothetical protein MYCTH_2301659 [Thermothelomyces thermophilus ATCC 42464]|uniref:Uncharacterized protein n=1 Tax=Thermothelomyces thermophilus (strain ATCC 42464 / BCRC 31852 / DSM 1799) TaxID=573729 RepID=G2Q9V5_THET4|nr:uncharacterized protein MYCTH_2301659 [Thermothelomyces thermophilus ATCC 42464]AEO56564.1 hypothetical protein MYCTH_2301659 [Thermothelomyces thermophilus ATCC 42464]